MAYRYTNEAAAKQPMGRRKTLAGICMAFAIAALIAIVGIGASLAPTSKAMADENLVSMYRMYNQWTGEHFYTKDAGERDDLMGVGWTFEGVGWHAPATGEDVYRLYNKWTGDHHYTMDAAERDAAVTAGWKYEGVGWKSMGDDATPLYRLFNPFAEGAGSHHYTTSVSERDALVAAGWKDEGVAWYGDPATEAEHPFYALFMGNDTRYGTAEDPDHKISADEPCRADTIMLARIDPVLLRVSVLSIPRDTMCYLDGGIEKINANHYYGPEGMVKAVEELTGTHIDYYFDEKFIDFDAMVDEMSGVNANVPFNISGVDLVKGGTVLLNKGNNQLLNGGQALLLARCRYEYEGEGEAYRQVSARQMVQNGIVKAANSGLPASFYASLMERVSANNIDEAVLADIINRFMGHGNEIQFQLGTGPYHGDMDWDAYQWYVPRDEGTYRQLVSTMESGGSLESVVPIPNAPEKAYKDMYRLYNKWSGEHFYTSDEGERDNLVAQGWANEGVAWRAPGSNGVPVYRLYNQYAPSGDHHYTMNADERKALVDAGWTDEGVCWVSDSFKSVPVYREYNPNELACNHNYTADKAEHDGLVSIGWYDEGVAWYGI